MTSQTHDSTVYIHVAAREPKRRFSLKSRLMQENKYDQL